jgi:protein-disulfide isomerase
MLHFLRALSLALLLPAAALAADPTPAPAAPAAPGASAAPAAPGAPGAPGASAAFSPAQRTAILDIVRNALKTDPSILRDAIVTLQADEAARDAAEAKGAIAAKQQDLLAHPGDPEAGNPHGDITVVEFYDPRCPYCRKMLPGIEAMLQKDHGVRLVYKDIPVLGPPSVMEARAIVAAQNQGAYLKMQAALMKNAAIPTEAMIRDTARAQGLNPDRLIADMNSAAVTQKIKTNLDLAHALKIQGTPAFVVGDQMIPGMVDADQLEDAVTQARKHA